MPYEPRSRNSFTTLALCRTCDPPLGRKFYFANVAALHQRLWPDHDIQAVSA